MTDQDFKLQEFLPYRLSLLANTVSQGIAASYLEQFGISVTEWRIIAVLGGSPGLTASEVMARTAMEKVPVSRAVKSLMKRTLLARKTDSDDRRCRRLELTVTGRGVYEEIIPRARAYETALQETLSQDELNVFDELLETLQQRATTLNTS